LETVDWCSSSSLVQKLIRLFDKNGISTLNYSVHDFGDSTPAGETFLLKKIRFASGYFHFGNNH